MIRARVIVGLYFRGCSECIKLFKHKEQEAMNQEGLVVDHVNDVKSKEE